MATKYKKMAIAIASVVVVGLCLLALNPEIYKKRAMHPDVGNQTAEGSQDGNGYAAKQLSVGSSNLQARAESAKNVDRDPFARDFAEIPGKTYRVTSLAGQFEDLARKAKAGDIMAARTLYNALNQCETSPISEQDLQDQIAKADDPKYPYAEMAGSVEQYYWNQISLFKRCGDLSSKQRLSARDWLSAMAENGDKESRVKYVITGKPKDLAMVDYQEQWDSYVADSRRYLEEEIGSGNADALESMGLGYSQLIANDHSMPFGDDPLSAYKYIYAYTLASSNSIEVGNMIPLLDKLGSRLTLEQIEMAKREAERLAKQCCI